MLNFTNYLIALVFLIFPSLTLVHGKTPGVAIHILAILSALYLIINNTKAKDNIKEFIQNYWLVCLITLIPLAYNFALNLLQGGHALFPSSLQRLALFPLALFILINLNNTYKINKPSMQIGIVIAGIASVIVLLKLSNYGAVRPNTEVHNLLNYTNFIVLLGLFSLFMTKIPVTKYSKLEIGIKLFSFICVVIAVVLSKSKGPLLSLLILFLLFVFVQTKGISTLKKISIILITILISVLVVNSNHDIKSRMLDAFNATKHAINTDKSGSKAGDASTRIRLNLWQASYVMFKENPWYGNSKLNFSEQLVSLNKQGKVNDETTWRSNKTAFMQPHNDLANMAATKGVPGIIMLLLLYLIPIRYYLKQKNQSTTIDTLSNMGLFLSFGFILFGLTVSTFTTGWMTAIFSLMHCMIISSIHHEKLNLNYDK